MPWFHNCNYTGAGWIRNLHQHIPIRLCSVTPVFAAALQHSIVRTDILSDFNIMLVVTRYRYAVDLQSELSRPLRLAPGLNTIRRSEVNSHLIGSVIDRSHTTYNRFE